MTHRVELPLAGRRADTFVGSACGHRRFSADFAIAIAGVGGGFIGGEGGGWFDHTAGSASYVFLGERDNTAVLFGQAYKQRERLPVRLKMANGRSVWPGLPYEQRERLPVRLKW
jgi:hypothetical protein